MKTDTHPPLPGNHRTVCLMPHQFPCLAYLPVIEGSAQPCAVCAPHLEKVSQWIRTEHLTDHEDPVAFAPDAPIPYQIAPGYDGDDDEGVDHHYSTGLPFGYAARAGLVLAMLSLVPSCTPSTSDIGAMCLGSGIMGALLALLFIAMLTAPGGHRCDADLLPDPDENDVPEISWAEVQQRGWDQDVAHGKLKRLRYPKGFSAEDIGACENARERVAERQQRKI